MNGSGVSSVVTVQADQLHAAEGNPAIDDGFEYDVCVIGTGRVGLPLGLSFLDAGLRSVGVDVDSALISQVNAGIMPFQEAGYDELVARRKFQIFDDPAIVSKSAAIVVTVGTPLHNHIETDLSQIERVLEEVTPHLREGQLICLRSTVAPGTTQFVRRWLERYTSLTVGADVFLAFCPERIAEGKSFTELHTLPQIIGSEDPESERRTTKLFRRITEEVLPTDYVTAELVKLFNNILRYVHFALANEFAMIADEFGANIYEAQRLANYKYPRSFLASPGLTAGTCLRKDFGMINERSPYPDMLLSAWKSNEFMPAFLVEKLLKRTDIHGRIVAILGFTFKADSDDLRDSLAPKLWRYIHRQLPAEIRVSEHHVADPIPEPSVGSPKNWPLEHVLEGVDIVFVATNHSEYRPCLSELGKRAPSVWVADIWNVGGIDRIFYQAGDLNVVGT
jgi:UDP-N-acetyl-D-mannosaminuronic acid dehydrogenase